MHATTCYNNMTCIKWQLHQSSPAQDKLHIVRGYKLQAYNHISTVFSFTPDLFAENVHTYEN